MEESRRPAVSGTLTRASFDALRHGEVDAIVLSDVIGRAECEQACRVVRELTANHGYLRKHGVGSVGTPVGAAHHGSAREAEYFDEAPATAALLRDRIFPFGSPIERLMQLLLLIWPAGVQIPSKDGRHFLPQIARRWVSGGGAHPHIDQSETPLLSPLGIGRRIGVNAYLSMPESGGALQFWKRSFSEAEYERLRRADYGLDRDLLGDADLTIRPEVGQMILFRAWEPHAVEPIGGGGDRITNGAFVCARGDEAPLAVFA